MSSHRSRALTWKTRAPRGPLATYYDWMAHVGSLTARLRRRCPRFAVHVLQQGLVRPHRDEVRLLGLRAGERAWVREVLLSCGGVPVVFAHSVVPRRAARGAWHLFAGLGARPLGEILFSDPRITRRPFRFASLDARHPLHRGAEAAVGASLPVLAGRRSLFVKQGRAMLLAEVFLPDILNLPDGR